MNDKLTRKETRMHSILNISEGTEKNKLMHKKVTLESINVSVKKLVESQTANLDSVSGTLIQSLKRDKTLTKLTAGVERVLEQLRSQIIAFKQQDNEDPQNKEELLLKMRRIFDKIVEKISEKHPERGDVIEIFVAKAFDSKDMLESINTNNIEKVISDLLLKITNTL